MVCAVNYDLRQPGRDYSGLHAAIMSLGPWLHPLGSTWLVDTYMPVNSVAAFLRLHIDQNDSLLVIGVTAEADGWLPHDAWAWIHQRRALAA